MRRIIALFLAVILALSTSAALAAEVDLSVMRTDELVKLREEIDKELTAHHFLTDEERNQLQHSIEENVESYLAAKNASSVVWNWDANSFRKDWNNYTAKGSVAYQTSKGRYEPNVYATFKDQNGTPELSYLELGEDILLHSDTFVSPVQETATPAPTPTVTLKPTETPRPTPTPTPKPTATPKKATATPKPTATPTPTAKRTLSYATPEPRSYYLLNEPAEFDGKTYTMIGYRTSSAANRSSAFKPAKGNEFLIVKFKIKVGNAYTYIHDVAMAGKCNGKLVPLSSTGLLECDPLLMFEPISPGSEEVGEVCFEVPKKWEKFEIYYTPTQNYDEAMVFVINR